MPKRKSNDKYRVVLAGGHAGTVMLALIEEILRLNGNFEIHIIGPKYSYSTGGMASLEKMYLNVDGVFYHEVDSARFSRRFVLKTILGFPKIVWGFMDVLKIMLKIRPQLAVVFGGYLGVPVSIASRIVGIPLIVHEQVVGVGLANRVGSLFARKILVSREESLKSLPKKKTILIGNPVRRDILSVGVKSSIGNPPTVFIFTGSRGSKIINSAFKESIMDFLSNFRVIHLTGKEDYALFLDIRSKLPRDLKERYEVFDFILPWNVAAMYKKSDIVVARAGANTVSEIMIIKRPSVFIPIPWSNFDEQNKNADYAVNFGIGIKLNQDELDGKKLFASVNFLKNNWKKIVDSVKDKESIDLLAAKKFARIVLDETINSPKSKKIK